MVFSVATLDNFKLYDKVAHYVLLEVYRKVAHNGHIRK